MGSGQEKRCQGCPRRNPELGWRRAGLGSRLTVVKGNRGNCTVKHVFGFFQKVRVVVSQCGGIRDSPVRIASDNVSDARIWQEDCLSHEASGVTRRSTPNVQVVGRIGSGKGKKWSRGDGTARCEEH
jgi:hypothetical protein